MHLNINGKLYVVQIRTMRRSLKPPGTYPSTSTESRGGAKGLSSPASIYRPNKKNMRHVVIKPKELNLLPLLKFDM
jgi:hypothetical protein